MSLLRGKKVLLIATAFFGYELKMKESLKRLGADVIFYDERAIKSQWEKALLKISPTLILKHTGHYYEEIIKQCRGIYFDTIYIYGATMINKDVIEQIKQEIANKRIILYLADSVRGNVRYEKMFPLFDKIATFDKNDFNYYKEFFPQFTFLPLFYSDEYKNIGNEKTVFEYDLAFVGTIHSDRMQFFEQIQHQAKELGLKTFFYMYLPAKFVFYYYFFTNSAFKIKKPSDFMYDKINANDICEILKKSRCIVDIQYPKNVGLTMRTFETLGMKRKLITTNSDIKNYDFYNESNILITDRFKPLITRDFLEREYVDIPDNIYKKYFIDSWMEELFA